MTTARRYAAMTAIALSLLAACGDQELILEGEREDIGRAAVNKAASVVQPVSLPAATANPEWTHVGGSITHRLAHPALSRSLTRIWSADIGEANDRRQRITADPVVAGGRVFTLDAQAEVRGHSTSGALLWARDLTPPADSSEDASGGGLAYGGGRLFATSGFGTLTALDPATGEMIWQQDFDAAATGAPTVFEGVVYAVTRNAVGWAIDAENGRILWQTFGATSASGLTGGPSPAIAGRLVLFPFSSGQIVAAVTGVGSTAWAASVPGRRLERTFSRISDLSGDVVVQGDRVYSANHSGRAAAFDATTGQQIWTADEGALNRIWVAGGSVFAVTDENRLLRLDAATGATVWAVELPFFTRTRIQRRKATFVHYGPVLAGGRLLIASNDSMLREFDPETGALISATTLPSGAARNPVVAGGVMYLVTENGQLQAFR